MARDVAMLRWLDSNANRKRQPNENFAREVMELFALGVGNYSEHDIKEAARAFSGWHLRNDEFWFKRVQHDSGTKSVFGASGEFGGDDILRLCLGARGLPTIPRGEVARAPSFRRTLTKRLSAPWLRASALTITTCRKSWPSCCARSAFFATEARRSLIKSPADLVLGSYRALGVRAKLPPSVQLMAELGQSLFEPPTVKGWEGGRRWINATSMLQSSNFAAELLAGNRYGRVARPRPGTDYTERAPRGSGSATRPRARPARADPVHPLHARIPTSMRITRRTFIRNVSSAGVVSIGAGAPAFLDRAAFAGEGAIGAAG